MKAKKTAPKTTNPESRRVLSPAESNIVLQALQSLSPDIQTRLVSALPQSVIINALGAMPIRLDSPTAQIVARLRAELIADLRKQQEKTS